MSQPSGDNGGSGSLPDGSTLDTTLLESLFYNEMLMLDDSSDLLSTITAAGNAENANAATAATTDNAQAQPKPAPPHEREVAPTTTTAAPQAAATGKPDDALTYAEQSLLRDFGVTGSPIPHISDDRSEHKSGDSRDVQRPPRGNHHHPQPHHPGHQQQHHHSSGTNGNNSYPAEPHASAQKPPPHPPQVQPYHGQPYPHNGHYHHQTNGYHHPQQQSYPSHGHQPQRVSKGIKHSVTPRQPTHSPQQQQQHPSPSVTGQPPPPPLIPNPLARQQPSHPPQVQPPPHQAHPAQAHPQHANHHYPHPHSHAPQPYPQYHHGVPAPAPPAPAPGHHQHSAFAPPPGSVPVPIQPHYSPPSAAHRPLVAPVAGHPPPPHTPAHHPAQHGHPHHHPHAYAASSAPSYPQPPKEQLISQFSLLANRLGINLPSEMLSSLTTSAGDANAEGKPSSCKGPPVPFVSTDTNGQAPSYASRRYSNSSSKQSDVESATSSAAVAALELSSNNNNSPFVDALRKTAEEAVAAVTRKRSHEDTKMPAATSDSNANSKISKEDKEDNKPSYAKRRKKPRLVDCENRLTQLRAENEKLKRHLDNITNQTERFQQDRLKAEDKMKEMVMSKETPDEELNKVIQEYSEAYSDYGKRRHEELSFHLDQLQKLANPTNFTKMALWTMAKANDSKNLTDQNPLVGILGKHLDVAPQQLRKMMSHREKIRDLCTNLNATMALIHQLSDLCEQKNKKFNDRLTRTREILQPTQVVKLILWIKHHSDVLSKICPGWTSEQVLKSSETPSDTTTPAVKLETPQNESATNTTLEEQKKPSAIVPDSSEASNAPASNVKGEGS
ncbi:Basic region leucine zipper [Seminavis robusta]|uniref:Basic region leucine zipper n=1 Tax=Seminavis robusta TaxID=568900 RepID=A0A9N8HUX7_9STRA|nr:Basic region leucine zipper [Seminavis robusta]|eukprot:Sro1711_g292870.1 Basic region leucine zipper (838) ;mRNA; r:20621-23229